MRQLDRCKVKVGDLATAVTQHGKRRGQVVELIGDPNECEWKNGTQPFFIVMRMPLAYKIDGEDVLWGTERLAFPLKKVRV